MAIQPYNRSSIDELENIVENNHLSINTLKQIADELKDRKTLRAKGMLLLVEKLLKENIDSFTSSSTSENKYDENRQEHHTDLTGETDDIIENFINALKIEVDEIKKRGFSSTVDVRDGKKIQDSSEINLYRFPNTEDISINDDTPVIVDVGGKETNGSIVSTANKAIVISLDESFGDHIPFAQIKTDDSFLVDRLRQRFENIQKDEASINFKMKMLRKLLGEININDLPSTELKVSQGNLNNEQWEAVNLALSNEVIFLWGPPGTGKTITLAKIIEAFYKNHKKILILSNTNLAVDTTLEKLCDELHGKDQGFDKGLVLRFGNMVKPELKDRYGKYVDINLALERLSIDLKNKKESIENKLNAVEKKVKPLRDIITAFELYEDLLSQIKVLQATVKRLSKEKKQHEQAIENFGEKLAKLSVDLEEAKASGGIKRYFKGLNPEEIEKEIGITKGLKFDSEKEYRTISNSLSKNISEKKSIENRLSEVQIKIRNESKADAKRTLQTLSNNLQELRGQISAINTQLSKLKDELLKNCRVLAATATQTFLKPASFSSFDTIVIDEASMLPLPVVSYASGLGNQNIIIAGDFRQLPPIVLSDHELVKKWVGQDVFSKAGISDAVKSSQKPNHLVKLTTQYRMEPEICSLINKAFYDGDLKNGSGAGSIKAKEAYPDIVSSPLTLIDSSKQYPFANFKPRTFSRYNILHAIGIRNLAFYLKQEGFIKTTEDVGIVTPYAAQAKFINKICTEMGLNEVETGTVHRFQGNEKDLIILDITDSYGPTYLSRFVKSNSLEEDGAKLINVALSRPRSRLVVFANIPYLEDKLPSGAYLRHVLFDMRNGGKVIPIENIIKLGPYDFPSNLMDDSGPDLSYDPGKTSFFSESDFYPAFLKDLEYASKVIVIYSAFITPNRVAFLSDIFRRKLSQGICIRAVTRPPASQGSMDPKQISKSLELLMSLGVIVDLRYSIHEKICFIDDDILWHGSLNPLSHTGRTDESMMRIVSKEACRMKAEFEADRLNKFKKDASIIDILSEQENPQCGDCGFITVFHTRGRYGPYFQCETGCGWSENLDQKFRKRSTKNSGTKTTSSTDKNKKICQECGNAMIIRTGRFGEFWGCQEFPRCRHTENI